MSTSDRTIGNLVSGVSKGKKKVGKCLYIASDNEGAASSKRSSLPLLSKSPIHRDKDI